MLLKINCSIHNPCGSFGRCEDDFKGQSTCSCKFWWTGPLCDTLSTGGKQVIAMGVITAIIVLIYYSLTVRRWLKKKKRQAKQKQIDPIVETKNENCSMSVKSDRMFKSVKLIITIIVGTIVLVIKGILLQKIQKEIVDKFHQQQPLYYEPPSICEIIYIQKELNIFTFSLACLLILLFIIKEKRKPSKRDSYCYGYITVPIPLDFFVHVNRTFTAITFAIVTNELANIATQFMSGNSASIGEETISTYLLQIVQVLIIGFHCYPILAAVYINTRFTLVCATLYVYFDFGMTIGFNDICQNSYYATKDTYNQTRGINTIFFLNYYGFGSELVFFQILINAPRYYCLAYISVELSILLIKRIWLKRKSNEVELTREQKNLLYSSLHNSIESQYVANLFGFPKRSVRANWIVRLFRLIYTWKNDFRFSSRVFCLYASIFLLLYFLTIQACVKGVPYLASLSELSQTIILTTNMNTTTESINSTLSKNSFFTFHLPNFVLPYIFAICIAFIITMIQLLSLLASIRRNLLQVFRGDDSEIPRWNVKENVNYVCNNIHFAGYLIGHVLWGYLLIACFIFSLGLIIDILISYELVEIMETTMKIVIPSFLLVLFRYYTNQLLGQYVFLQQDGDVLSINHRQIFMVYLYFNFFLDALLSFISSILPVVKSAISGILYMCRLDYSPMGRKLESYETGFNAYCGFIHMECAHRHPVLLYFTSLLIRQQLYRTQATHQSMARRRWYLAIFLLKNPTLVYQRRRTITTFSIDENKVILIGRRNVIQALPNNEARKVINKFYGDENDAS